MEKLTHIELTDIQCQDVKPRSFDASASSIIIQVNNGALCNASLCNVSSVEQESFQTMAMFSVCMLHREIRFTVGHFW